MIINNPSSVNRTNQDMMKYSNERHVHNQRTIQTPIYCLMNYKLSKYKYPICLQAEVVVAQSYQVSDKFIGVKILKHKQCLRKLLDVIWSFVFAS